MSPLNPGRSAEGRVVIVTGASSGNGRATARTLAENGAIVVAVARSGDRLDVLAAEQPGVEPLVADLTVAEDRVRVVEATVARHGRIDGLVNNAGVGLVGYLEDFSAEDLERLYATNVVAVADLSRLAIPHLRASKGDLVMISSAGAWASIPPLVAYCSSKFAVDGLVEGLRRELWHSGVRVHSVNPGPIKTEYMSRATGYSPDENDPVAVPNPGFSPQRVADAVLKALGASHPRTFAVPRVFGVARLAQVPPVGAALDVLMGLTGRRVTDYAQKMVARRTP
ncbi:MAG: short-chain dehydrogenase/reductase [Frankiales bacterium]|jgi:NAD(P)-dependent dehydrogenase (short-subunit alcohol dehydrogenase family)|nr:short-chain dehydrogenase/reductase [Frankiales bacterium]